MTLKLYGYSRSTCTRKVRAVLAEKQVPYEFVSIDLLKGEHKTPEYLKKQPFGQVPYIDDDGFILFESRAISRYIAAKYASQGTPLIPTDPKAFAKVEEAISFETSGFETFASVVVFEKVFKTMIYGGTADEDRAAEALKKLDAKLDVYDSILSKQKYIAGNEITLADLFHLPYGSYLAVGGCDIMESKPNVARWWKDISSRPPWQSIIKD